MTPDQIIAILMLLSAFGVDQPTLDIVRTFLVPSVAQSATISPMQPAPTVPTTPAPQAINTPAKPAVPAQTAPAFVPFVRTGTASATLVEKDTTLPLSGGRNYLVTLSVKNDTNETLGLSDLGVSENSFFVVSNNSIAGWQPRLVGIYRNVEFRQDQRGIKPGETVEVRFILDSYPAVAGTFDLSIKNIKLIGRETGNPIELSGFPLTLGTFTVQ